MTRILRLGAVLLAVSFAFHELAYAIVGDDLVGAQGGLDLFWQVVIGGTAACVAAACVVPLLGRPGRNPHHLASFAFAGALLAILFTQEAAESAILGTGPQGLLAAFAMLGLTAPLALGFGVIAAGIAVLSDLASDKLARRRVPHRRRRAFRAPVPVTPNFFGAFCAGLAFGFARRPPPLEA